jgi:hypothetical protein
MWAACHYTQLSRHGVVADRRASQQPGCVIHRSKTSLFGVCFCNRGNILWCMCSTPLSSATLFTDMSTASIIRLKLVVSTGSFLVNSTCKPEILSLSAVCCCYLLLPLQLISSYGHYFGTHCHVNAVSVSAEKTNRDTDASWFKSKLNRKRWGESCWLCSRVSMFMTLSVRILTFCDRFQWIKMRPTWLTSQPPSPRCCTDHCQCNWAVPFSERGFCCHGLWNEAVFNHLMYIVVSKGVQFVEINYHFLYCLKLFYIHAVGNS